MTSPLGTIHNKSSKLDRVSAVVKQSIVLAVGLCYIDGANGVKSAPTNGSKDKHELFWNPLAVTTVAGEEKKITIYELPGLQVSGKSDGIIVVDAKCKPSTNHGGDLITHTVRTDSVANNQTDNDQYTCVYRCHEDEIKEGSTRTNSADLDEDCIFEFGVN